MLNETARAFPKIGGIPRDLRLTNPFEARHAPIEGFDELTEIVEHFFRRSGSIGRRDADAEPSLLEARPAGGATRLERHRLTRHSGAVEGRRSGCQICSHVVQRQYVDGVTFFGVAGMTAAEWQKGQKVGAFVD